MKRGVYGVCESICVMYSAADGNIGAFIACDIYTHAADGNAESYKPTKKNLPYYAISVCNGK